MTACFRSLNTLCVARVHTVWSGSSSLVNVVRGFAFSPNPGTSLNTLLNSAAARNAVIYVFEAEVPLVLPVFILIMSFTQAELSSPSN